MNTPNKNQLRRLSVIVYHLNTLLPVTQIELTKKVNRTMDENFSKSTVEKDLFYLKMNFDLEYMSGKNGIQLIEKVDFIQRLKEYLNIFE